MRARGSQANAKEDTRLLLLGSDIDSDLSQYAADLTTIGAGAYEINSARTALSSAWEIYVRCQLSPTDTDKVLIANHSADLSAITWALRTSSGGYFTVMINGVDNVWKGPTVPTGDCSFAWSMRDNPDTTGSSNAKLSTFVVYDHTAGAYLAIEQLAHEAPTASATHTLSVGGAYFAAGPALVNAPANAPSKARVSSTYHGPTEFAEDWIAARTAYAGTLEDVAEEPIPIPVASGLGDSGQFVGRAQLGHAARLARVMRRRGWSPLVNEVYVDPDTMTSTPAPAQWVLPDSGAGTYSLMLQYLRWVPVPLEATHAFVRVQLKSYVAAGAAVPVGVRCYAMNRPSTIGHIGQKPAPAFEHHFREAVITADHTGTDGEWIDLGLLRLPRFAANIPGWTNTVHLCLAYAIDPGGSSTNDANARLEINAWHVRPVNKWTPGALE